MVFKANITNCIKAVIFDLGKVLVDLDTTRGIFDLLNHRPKIGKKTGIQLLREGDLFGMYNAGRLSPQQFYKELCRRCGIEISFDEFVNLWCDVFKPMEGMEELLGELYAGYTTLGLLSDTDPLHWAYLRRNYPMLEMIPKPTLSFETGYRKPSAESFLAAARNVGIAAENCLYIDDLIENVEGARRVGMEAIHFQDAEKLREELIRRGLLAS
jgi:HAD superfamily hydrolase (TIGR01509 family)